VIIIRCVCIRDTTVTWACWLQECW